MRRWCFNIKAVSEAERRVEILRANPGMGVPKAVVWIMTEICQQIGWEADSVMLERYGDLLVRDSEQATQRTVIKFSLKIHL